MKKLFILSLVAVMFVGFGSADALTEAELKAKIDEVTAKGITITDGAKKQINDYLEKYDLTAEECDVIASDIDKAIEIIKAENVSDVKSLTAASKDKLKALVTDVTTNTSVKATITDGAIVVLNSDGTVFAEVDNKVVKNTGKDYTLSIIAGVSFVVTLVGAYFVVRQVSRING